MIDQFIKLFRGRGDALGTWHGGSRRCSVIREDFTLHLMSDNPGEWIGSYPHLGHRGVSWGCIDIDGKDFRLNNDADEWDWPQMLQLARNLQAALNYKAVNAHIEQTRNGFHIWVFPEAGVVPAATMRRSLMAACKACKYDPKEVNPKSEELAPGKLGNYVRLPHPGCLHPDSDGIGDNRFFLDADDQPMTIGTFLDTVTLTETAALEAVAKLWTPPAVVKFDGPPPEDVKPIVAMLDGLTYTVWKDGPLEGRDRSSTLARLAHLLCAEGIAMPCAFSVVKDADSRWGKFAGRSDEDEQIMNIVERAYAE